MSCYAVGLAAGKDAGGQAEEGKRADCASAVGGRRHVGDYLATGSDMRVNMKGKGSARCAPS